MGWFSRALSGNFPWGGSWRNGGGLLPNFLELPLNPSQWSLKNLLESTHVNAANWLLDRWLGERWTKGYRTVYSIAGDRNNRLDFLRGAVLASQKLPIRDSLGGSIVQHHIEGPAFQLQRFSQWAHKETIQFKGQTVDGFCKQFGWAKADFNTTSAISAEKILPHLPTVVGKTTVVLETEIATPLPEHFAMQWLLENHPQIENFKDLEVTQLESDLTVFNINLPNQGSWVMPTPDVDFDERYLYVHYAHVGGSTVGAVITHTPTEVALNQIPDTQGWELVSESFTTYTKQLAVQTTITTTPPGGSSASVTTSSSSLFTVPMWKKSFTKESTTSPIPGEINKTKHTMVLETIVTIGSNTSTQNSTGAGGENIQTTVVAEVVNVAVRVSTTEQTTTQPTLGANKVFIYQMNTGNAALDELMGTRDTAGEIVPAIPLRLQGSYIDGAHHSGLYPISKEAFRRAIRDGNYDEFIEELKTGSAEDMQYCIHLFLQFGVTLNTLHKRNRRYLYEFFKALDNSRADYKASVPDTVKLWQKENAKRRSIIGSTDTTKLELIGSYPTVPGQSFTWGTFNNTNNGVSFALQWQSIHEETKVAVATTEHPVGDIWWEVGPTLSGSSIEVGVVSTMTDPGDEYTSPSFETKIEDITGTGEGQVPATTYSFSCVLLHRQVSKYQRKTLHIYGLQHVQNVLGSFVFGVSAADAIADSKDTAFIVPIHIPTLRKCPLTVGAQVGSEAGYLVFNYFVEGRTPWYASGTFRVIVTIVAVVVSVWSLGTTTQFWWTLLYMLATMAAIYVVTELATRLWGKEVGAYVGLAASIYLGFSGGVGNTAGSNAAAVSATMNAQTLLMLTASVGNTYSKVLAIEAEKLQAEASEAANAYNVGMDKIAKMYEAFIGTPTQGIDPLLNQKAEDIVPTESPSTFLQRTLMTGSDIANLGHTMISDFTKITTSTSLEY